MNKYSQIFFFVVLLGAIFFNLKCKKEPTQPPVDINKDPRTYTWTVDTLEYPGSMQTTMRDIWASSPTDVYVVGHNDQPGPGTMFHYNGKKWSTTHFHSADGGTISGPVDLSAVYGFGPNDVYAVGERIYTNPNPPPNFLDSSLIIHFDGQAWREIPIPRERNLSTIWGINSFDIWAGGSVGTLYHYQGGNWIDCTSDRTIDNISGISGFSENEVFIFSVKEDSFLPQDSLINQLWKFNGTNFSCIDSFTVSAQNLQWKFGWCLWQFEGILYSSGYGVYKREGSIWQKFLDCNSPLRIHGSSSSNIFAVGDYGKIFHWNGSNWKELSQLENTSIQFLAVWVCSTDAFIVGNDGNKTFILHGK